MNRLITDDEERRMNILCDDGQGSQYVELDGDYYDVTNGYISNDADDLAGWEQN